MTKLRTKQLLYLLKLVIFLFSCTSREEEIKNSTNVLEEDTLLNDTEILKKSPDTINIEYTIFYIADKADLDSFASVFNSKQRRIISDLNRIDETRIKQGDSIGIPFPLLDSLIYYSPFPYSIEVAENINKILLISRKIQASAAYENGKLIRWGPASLGKESTPTPAGLYFTNWKAKSTISTVNEEWLLKWSFNIHNFRGISIHEYTMPGYPASHACVRLKQEDAFWFYHWAEQWKLTDNKQEIKLYGTPVIIYDEYDFNSSPPWKKLAENANITNQTEEKLNDLITLHLDLILQRQAERDSLQADILQDE